MAPSSQQEARLRKAVLSLAKETEFGKRMVNGGRLSVPSVYDTPLSTADSDAWRGGPRPGASMPDAPIAGAIGPPMFLTEAFIKAGTGFTLLEFGNGAAPEVPEGVTVRIGGEDGFADPAGLAGCSATTPSPARPICCGPTAMSPRASGTRRGRRWMRRWPRAAASQLRIVMALSTSSNFAKPDDAFRAIVEAHRGLSDAQSADLDAALVLMLANHIGDLDVLREAIALAKRRMVDASNSSSNSNDLRLKRSQGRN